MRILFLTYSLEVGGAERQLVCLANELSRRGHQVAVGVFYSGGPLETELDLSKVTLIDFQRKSRWAVPAFLIRYIRELRAWRPQIVHGYMGMPNMLSCLAKLVLPKVRAVWGVRSDGLVGIGTGGVARFVLWAESKTARFADLVLINSAAGRKSLVDSGFSHQSPKVIPNGIDINVYVADRKLGSPLRRQWLGNGEAVLVGIVGRLDVLKDHPTFLKAAGILAAQDAGVRFICVGDGPAAYAEELRVLADTCGLGDRVGWAGRMSDMPAAYNALDICCLSSTTEGFPNVLGEAMACGVPCVTTDVGDAAMIVGNTGEVVAPGNPEALADGMRRLLQRVRAGEDFACRERVVRSFSLAHMADETEAALKRVLS